MTKTEHRQQSRRSVLNRLLGFGLFAWLASVLYPVLRYLRPAPERISGPVRLTPDELAKIDKESFCITRLGTNKIIVFRPGGQLRALDAKCTHEGCTVQFLPGESIVFCACHNGKYDLDGRVLSGPPPRPLAQWVVTAEGDQVLVSKEPT